MPFDDSAATGSPAGYGPSANGHAGSGHAGSGHTASGQAATLDRPDEIPTAEPVLVESSGEPSLTSVVEFGIVAIRRHLLAGFMVGFLICALTVAYLYLAPRTYLSSAKLYVRLGRESITIDPTASTGETMQVAENRENQINSVLEIISSENIYDQVVRQLGPDVVLGLADVPDAGAPGTDSTATDYAHRKAVTLLQKTIDLEAVKRSNIIYVTAESTDPLLAQRVLQTFLDAAERLYLDSTRSDGSVELFTNESARIERDYDVLAGELAEIKSRVGVSSIEDRRKTLQEQLSKSESDIDAAEARLAKSEATVDALAESLRNVDEYETSRTSNQPEDARGQAGRDISKLQIKEQELLAKYTERHPQVQQVREQITKATAMLDETDPPMQETATISPVWQGLNQKREIELAEIKATQAELTSLKSSRETIRLRLSEVNDAEGDIASREEMLKSLRKTRADYSDKLQQARMDDVMSQRRLSDISIPQPATYQPKAIAPKKRLIAAAGLVLATLLSLSTMLLLEGWSRSRDRLRSILATA